MASAGPTAIPLRLRTSAVFGIRGGKVTEMHVEEDRLARADPIFPLRIVLTPQGPGSASRVGSREQMGTLQAEIRCFSWLGLPPRDKGASPCQPCPNRSTALYSGAERCCRFTVEDGAVMRVSECRLTASTHYLLRQSPNLMRLSCSATGPTEEGDPRFYYQRGLVHFLVQEEAVRSACVSRGYLFRTTSPVPIYRITAGRAYLEVTATNLDCRRVSS